MNQSKIWNRLYFSSNQLWKKETLKLPKILRDKSILELGVGNGKTLISILSQNPKSVTAIDFSKEAIKQCKLNIPSKKVDYVCKDFLKYYPKEKFDVIVCYYFLNNLKEKQREQAAKKIIQILNFPGYLLFQDFAIGDIRQKGKSIEKNTICKSNGLICHFFSKQDLISLFKLPKNHKITEKSFPIVRGSKEKRRIISFIAKNI